MGSIKDRVAIIGMGCTKFGENWGRSRSDMIVEAAYEAFQDAGVEHKDIQAAWFSTTIPTGGFTGMMLAEPLKLHCIPVTRLENACATASDAVRNASYAVASGVYDLVLVLGVEKLKDSGYSGLPDSEGWHGWDNTYRQRTLTGPGTFALMATGYFAKYGLSPEEGKTILAKIAVKNHHNGTLHPKAHFQREITMEQALNAPIIAWPLGLFDCCGVSDGAAAAVLTRAEIAKNFKSDPVYIKALQLAVGARSGFMSTAYKWDYVEETFSAGQAAYTEAGITNPREEVSMAEVHDCFTITELVTMEDLQFSQRGKAPVDVESGFFSIEGGLPVNTDGGLKCFGHPIGASGLRMLYEVYNQLLERASPRQLKEPKLGLTHNLGGTPGGAAVSVIIAGKQ